MALKGQGAIVERLEKRAMRRKWWKKWKRTVLLLVMLALAIPASVAFTPIGPGWVKDYIEKYNPPTQEVKPWGTRYLYYLAFFLHSTMREKQAVELYDKLYREWYVENYETMKIPEGDVYVGMAVYHHANVLRRKLRRQRAKELYAWYLQEFATNPASDPHINDLVKRRVRIIEKGG